ncbi:PQQ-dependent sugar dehydrogenase [Micromonospora zamorensis]|uniref:PQQ-dependent sugar dehydrogenase n=1 Tax=Micromonospora zamorensis TaxID=709883 RepID=UPI0008200D76|nr:PQQ-dependent sugar dehydrogenase [Micromonospora zamorensis]WSK47081.1 PQQ-dependent sugar dehydrogenase [Micromonospora zamorensis]WTE84263.1 PQQ-dependent sugar dehydrogenase [Micromonospora zamorensis]SCG38517.1 Glucose/arabinose dehydrogenase, beta-propeller fold [Micromonospora zamorensis]
MRLRAVLTVVTLAIALGTAVSAEAGVRTPDGSVTAAGAGGFDFAQPEVVATGLEAPWGLDFLPDGSALVAQRNQGTVLRVRPGQPTVQVARIAGVVGGGEGGLLGLAVSPRYRLDRWVYVCFTTASDIRIARFRLNAPQRQQVIFSGPVRASIHNGGRIAFGPDGMLYVGVGDAGVPSNAQNLASRNGKILRIRPNGGVPAGNPFPGSPVFSYGHRNVQGLAWDAQGRLFATEFGQATWDEVNRIVPGGNYGWPVVEGPSNDPRFRAPVVVWPPAQASPSGAAFAGGTLFVAALRGARLWAVPISPAGTVGTPSAELVGAYGRLRTVEVAPDGSLWVATSNRDGNGTPRPQDDRILRFTTGERQPPPAGRAGFRLADPVQP